jgi:tetratricopeptide (TPR) repeat protein
MLQGDYESAIEDFDRAIELDDQDAKTYSARGEAYFKMGDVDQAMADFDRAIEIDPQLMGAHYFRGVAFADLGDYDRALADLDKAIDLNPQDAWPYSDRGYVYWITNNPSHAIADLDQAIELDPQLDQAYHFRGLAHYELGNYEKAFEDFNRAIKLDPQTADYFLSRGLIHAELSESEAAITDLETALELGLATELEQFANEVLEDLNSLRSSGLVLEWLVTADELNTISDEIGITEWDSVAEFEREYGVCRAYNGISWRESPNVATNCFFSVTPHSTFEEFIKWLEEMEILPPSAIQIMPKIEYPGEYGFFVNNLDNGYADFNAIYLADGVAYWTSVSVGSQTADSPAGVYYEFGEAIDSFLIDILKINFENSGFSPPTSE